MPLLSSQTFSSMTPRPFRAPRVLGKRGSPSRGRGGKKKGERKKKRGSISEPRSAGRIQPADHLPNQPAGTKEKRGEGERGEEKKNVCRRRCRALLRKVKERGRKRRKEGKKKKGGSDVC